MTRLSGGDGEQQLDLGNAMVEIRPGTRLLQDLQWSGTILVE